MDKSGAKFKFVGHSTEIIRQSKNKGTLERSFGFSKKFEKLEYLLMSGEFCKGKTVTPATCDVYFFKGLRSLHLC